MCVMHVETSIFTSLFSLVETKATVIVIRVKYHTDLEKKNFQSKVSMGKCTVRNKIKIYGEI